MYNSNYLNSQYSLKKLMGSDQLKHIKENIKKSGFPLELFVSSKISKYNFPQTGEYFFDPSENTHRSVDFFVPHFAADDSKMGLSSNLVIECKKSERDAWVFFELNDVVLQPHHSGQWIDYEDYLSGNYQKSNLMWKYDWNLNLHYHAALRTKRSRQFYVVKKGNKNTNNDEVKDSIFEALNQILKFIEYRTKKAEQNIANTSLNQTMHPIFTIYYPIIVFDGFLVNAFLDNNEELQVEEKKHVILSYDYQPDYCDNPQTFYIDIVKKEYLEEFLKDLEDESTMINKHLEKNREEFMEHCKSIQLTNPRTWSA